MSPHLKLPTIAALAVAAVAFTVPADAAERHGDNSHRGQRYEQQQDQPAYRGTRQRNESYRKTERAKPNKAQRDANRIKRQAREERATPRKPQGNANRNYGYTQPPKNRDNRVVRNNDRYSGDRNRQRNDYRDGRGNRFADNDRYRSNRDNRPHNYRDNRSSNYRDHHDGDRRDNNRYSRNYRDHRDGDRRDNNRYSRNDHRKDYRDHRNYRDRGYRDHDHRDRYYSYRGKRYDRDRYRYNYKRQKHWAKAYSRGYRTGRYDSRRYDYYRPYWDFGYFHKHRHYYNDWRPYFGRLWLGFGASIAWQSSYDDDCHPVTRIDYYHGRSVLVGAIMCYDRWGQAFIVPESEEILHWY